MRIFHALAATAFTAGALFFIWFVSGVEQGAIPVAEFVVESPISSRTFMLAMGATLCLNSMLLAAAFARCAAKGR